MWSLAHEQGIALPTRDFWEFDRLVTVSDPRGVPDLDSLDRIYHLTELIQSSPLAVERSVHGAIGGAYRSQRITTLELRFNPMKRNRGGERDLDHIILAAIRGLDRASLEYPQVRCGLILMMDRTFTAEQNMVIVEKAIALRAARDRRRRHRGAAAGRRARTTTRRCATTSRPRATAGLGVTIHVGEEGGRLRRRGDRRGACACCGRTGSATASSPRGEPELMEALREAEITLEICPTSNLLTKALAGEDEVRETFRTFVDNGVPFTIATDGPEMMRTHLRDEFELLLRVGALDEDEARAANARGHAVRSSGRDAVGARTARRGSGHARRCCRAHRLRDAGALVAQPEQLDHLVRVLVGLDRLRDPARVRQDVVRVRAAGLDEHVAHRALERQVGEPVAVQVAELALAEPELDAAEAVRVRRSRPPSSRPRARSVRRASIAAVLPVSSPGSGCAPCLLEPCRRVAASLRRCRRREARARLGRHGHRPRHAVDAAGALRRPVGLRPHRGRARGGRCPSGT